MFKLSGIERVKKFIRKYNVKAEVLKFESTVETVSTASKASGYPERRILKTLIVFADGKPYVAIVRGDKKLDFKKFAKAIGARRVRLAKINEVLGIVGVKPGEVSPLLENILKLPVILDDSILEENTVLVGGGSLNHLVKINVSELIRILNPKIAKIAV